MCFFYWSKERRLASSVSRWITFHCKIRRFYLDTYSSTGHTLAFKKPLCLHQQQWQLPCNNVITRFQAMQTYLWDVPGSRSHTLSFWSIKTLYCQRLHFLWASNWGWNVNWCWSSFLAFSSDLRSHSDKAFQKSELNNKFVRNHNWYQLSTSVEFWHSTCIRQWVQLAHILF